MTMIDDILAERDVAVGIITKQMIAANDLKINGAQGMDDKINSLAQQKATIAAQAYTAALSDPAMIQALAALKAATKDMSDVASKMTAATTFISNFNSFLSAANKIVPILQGTG